MADEIQPYTSMSANCEPVKSLFRLNDPYKRKCLIRITIRIAILILASIPNGWVYGSDFKYTFTEYSMEQGLNQHTIRAMFADKQGYMWFATYNGISRFDGHSFRSYNAWPDTNSELQINRIRFMQRDDNGYIWIVDHNDWAYRLDPASGVFMRFHQQTQPATSMTVSDNQIWILQRDGVLFRLYYRDDKIVCQKVLDQTSGTKSLHGIINANDKIWIVTNNGIYTLYKELNKVVRRYISSEDKFYYARKWQVDFLITGTNGLFYYYDTKTNTLIRRKLATDAPIVRIKHYYKDDVLLITENDGFFYYNVNLGPFHHYRKSELPSTEISSSCVDSYQNVWITYNNIPQVTRFNILNGVRKTYDLTEQTIDGYTAPRRRTLLEDRNKRLWALTMDNLLNYYDPASDSFKPFLVAETDSHSGLNIAQRIYTDGECNLWITKPNNGVVKVSFKEDLFDLHGRIVGDAKYKNEVRSMLQLNDNTLWCGDTQGNIRVYDSKMSFVGYMTMQGRISKNAAPLSMVYAMCQMKNGDVWIGTKDEGVYRFKKTGNSGVYDVSNYIVDPADPFSINSNTIYSISQDKKGRVWIGTEGGGVNYVENPNAGRIGFINQKNNLLGYPIDKCSRVRHILVDSDDNIWAGTTNGVLLCRLTQSGKMEYRMISRNSAAPETLSNNNVYQIFETRKGELYFVTFGGGVNKLISSDNGEFRFKHFAKKQGLSDVPLAMIEDDSSNIWISAEEGLFKFFTSNDSLECYDHRFIPQSIQLSETLPIKYATGQIVLGTNNGVLSFNPYRVRKNTRKPNIVIEALTTYKNDENRLRSESGEVTLSHKENSFTVIFRALSMKYPEKIEYQYRLAGFDDWNSAGTTNRAVYTNVPKGEYRFEVRSTNSDGVWVENTDAIDIEILPSFFESVYGIITIILLFILAVAVSAVILLRIYKLKNIVEIEKQVFAIKSKFFTDVVHELRTPFTLIMAPLETLLSNRELRDADKYNLKLIKRNTQYTLKLINQLLDLQKIQNQCMKMRVQCVDLCVFTRNIAENFRMIALQRNSEIFVEAQPEQIHVWIDTAKMESILFNLISNAFKYSPRETDIRIKLSQDNEYVYLKVCDNGYGITPEKQQSVFKRFENYVTADVFRQQSTGIGLSLVKELTEMHKGYIMLDSEVDEGSEFTVAIPLGREHFDDTVELIMEDYDESQVGEVADTLFSRHDYNVEDINKLSSDKETLLVVEDNEDLREFLYHILSESFRVITAENGKEGMEKAEKFQPSMIISDVVMPVMNGLEMVKQLKATQGTSHIPIVMLSSKSSVEDMTEGLLLGIDDYIPKPFSADHLKARIFNIIEQRRRLQALYYAELMKQADTEEESADRQFETIPKSDRLLLEKIYDYIDENIEQAKLNVESIAQEMGISRSVLLKKVKALTGLSPVELIRNIRMKKAVTLIDEGSYNFTQIAFMTGFSDSQYFSRSFKAVYGITPSEYKEQGRSK